mmetsp:Transcript_703/g.1029  ORF Transcript_703/g.1029 Transcript_703/m.1029 type:complete len:415 (-) Transcript_703:3207-4451(-)
MKRKHQPAVATCASRSNGYLDEYACSVNLFPEWKRCCQSIMTQNQAQMLIHEIDERDQDFLEVINLLPEVTVLSANFALNDPWLIAAYKLNDSIVSMSTLLQERGRDYADYDFVSNFGEKQCSVTETEKSFMEASVLSYTMRTANQIDILRQKLAGTPNSEDMTNHKNGIIAILLQSLRQQIAMPMEALQKLRRREANLLRQNPLSCHSEIVGLVDDDLMDEKPRSFQYTPQKSVDTLVLALESCTADEAAVHEAEDARLFWSAYDNYKEEQIPPFFPNVKNVALEDETYRVFHEDDHNFPTDEQIATLMPSTASAPSDPISGTYPSDVDDELRQELYQEHLLLSDTFKSSDHDDIRKMENTMVEITSLLNQFSHLISDQQEDVLLLHEKTKTAKTAKRATMKVVAMEGSMMNS